MNDVVGGNGIPDGEQGIVAELMKIQDWALSPVDWDLSILNKEARKIEEARRNEAASRMAEIIKHIRGRFDGIKLCDIFLCQVEEIRMGKDIPEGEEIVTKTELQTILYEKKLDTKQIRFIIGSIARRAWQALNRSNKKASEHRKKLRLARK